MPYAFNVKQEGHYSVFFKYLDGDKFKLSNIDQSVTFGKRRPPDSAVPICGRAIDPTYLPRRLRPNLKKKRYADFLGNNTGTLVSDTVREIVERIEPGVHAFYPVTFEFKNGDTLQTHSVWIIQRELTALAREGIDPPYPGPDVRWEGVDTYTYPKARILLDKSIIGDAHAWSDPQLYYQRYLSDELTQAFLDAEVTGFAPGRYVEAV